MSGPVPEETISLRVQAGTPTEYPSPEGPMARLLPTSWVHYTPEQPLVPTSLWFFEGSPSLTCCWKGHLVSPMWRAVWKYLSKLQVLIMLVALALPLPGLYPVDILVLVQHVQGHSWQHRL